VKPQIKFYIPHTFFPFFCTTYFPSTLLTPHLIETKWVKPCHFMWQYLLRFISHVQDDLSLKYQSYLLNQENLEKSIAQIHVKLGRYTVKRLTKKSSRPLAFKTSDQSWSNQKSLGKNGSSKLKSNNPVPVTTFERQTDIVVNEDFAH